MLHTTELNWNFEPEERAMLYEFLTQNRKEILDLTEEMSLDLAGVRPSSEQLKQGLPIFYKQLLNVLQVEAILPREIPRIDKNGIVRAAKENDEPAMSKAMGRPNEAVVATAAGLHGTELLRLGYTLSHVIHAYGAICQSITAVAMRKKEVITASEFHDLNRCLDVAIAGAVTEYQALRNSQESNREVEHLGFLAHELRNALAQVSISIQMIKRGTVGFGGSTGQVLDRGLKRIEELIDRSLTEVRLRVDPKVHLEKFPLLQVIDQIIVTAEVEALSKNQTLEIHVDSDLMLEADEQLIHSALSNLIQNALKYSRAGGKIQVRSKAIDEKVIVEIEDECGGLPSTVLDDLFKPFEQQNKNRDGMGLGLAITRRAIELNRGTVEVRDLPNKGCVFKVILPRIETGKAQAVPLTSKAR
jgi:signal transduction histidine kinase